MQTTSNNQAGERTQFIIKGKYGRQWIVWGKRTTRAEAEEIVSGFGGDREYRIVEKNF